MKYRFDPDRGRSDLAGQMELPQTGQRLADLAKRKAAEPMRATKEQKPCDHGLFSDEQMQIDLEEILS